MPGQGEVSAVAVVFGVIQDGGGGVLDPKTGKIIVPPRQPPKEALQSFLINEMVRDTKTSETLSLQRTALEGIQKYLEEETKVGPNLVARDERGSLALCATKR